MTLVHWFLLFSLGARRCACAISWNNIPFPFWFSVQSSVGHNIFLWVCSNAVISHMHSKRWGWTVCSFVFPFKRAHLKLGNQSLFQVLFLKAHMPLQVKKVTSVGIAKCPNSSTRIQDLTSPFGAPGFVCQPGTQIPSVGKMKPLLCRCLKPDQGNLTLQRICLLLCLPAFIRIAVHSTV